MQLLTRSDRADHHRSLQAHRAAKLIRPIYLSATPEEKKHPLSSTHTTCSMPDESWLSDPSKKQSRTVHSSFQPSVGTFADEALDAREGRCHHRAADQADRTIQITNAA
jgi:hypothetical protein